MPNEVVEILQKVGAIFLNDHFVGTSGRHLGGYVNKDALFPHTQETCRIGELFAEKFKDYNIDTVAAPAMGGIILSQWVAYHLSRLTGREVLSAYAEKVDGTLKLTRGYDLCVKGKKVLAIEDLTTTGGSLKKLVEVVQEAGGKIVATSVMLNKDPELVTAEMFGVPFMALAETHIPSFDEADCPLCKNNIPINTTLGHGKKFLQEKGLIK